MTNNINKNVTSAFRKEGGWTILELMIVLFVISILAVIAVPSYHSYLMRSKIGNDLKLVSPIKLTLTEYYIKKGKWPVTNAAADLSPKEEYSGKWLLSAEIGNTPTDGSFTLIFDNTKLPDLGENNTIVFYPTAGDTGVIWLCDAGTMVERYRPPQCR